MTQQQHWIMQIEAILQKPFYLPQTTPLKPHLKQGPPQRAQYNLQQAYLTLRQWNALNPTHFLQAHQVLLGNLNDCAGEYRTQNVHLRIQGRIFKRVCPPEHLVEQMQNLFETTQGSAQHPLILAAEFHYKMVCIHPFCDGNGRLARFWHTVLMQAAYPHNDLARLCPMESVLKRNSFAFYHALSQADALQDSNIFVDFALQSLLNALNQTLRTTNRP